MSFEVAEGQTLIHSGTRYRAGALAPSDCDVDALCAVGVLVEVKRKKAAPRPNPERVPAAPRAGFDPSDPSTVRSLTLRELPAALAGVDDVDALKEMHEIEPRKGGKDAIEERIGEIEAGA
jgi:hypothetical protein